MIQVPGAAPWAPSIGSVGARLQSHIRAREALFAAVALFLVLAPVYLFSVGIRATRGASITGDEPFYLLTTQSIIEDGDLDLRNQYAARSYESFFDHPDGLWKQSVPLVDGRLLSPHNPGLSILVIPGFALGGLAGAQVQLLLIAAATMALAFLLADRLTGRRALSWLVALGIGTGAVAFIHSTEVYPEFPAALALVVGLLLVTKRDRPGQLDAVWLAAALTAMCWLGVKYAPLAMLVAGYLLLRADRMGRAALLLLGGVSASLFLWFHVATFGGLTPYAVGVVYSGQSTVEILGNHVEIGDRAYRLWGLFVDRRFGVGRWSPLLLVAIPGLALLAFGRAPHRLVLGLIGIQLLIATFVAITMMGWWFAGRTLVTVLPLFVVTVAVAVDAAPRWGSLAAACLGAYGVLIAAGLARAALTGEVTIAVDPFNMGYPPFQALSWIFPDYRAWTWETWGLTTLWLALFALFLAMAVRHGKSPRRHTI